MESLKKKFILGTRGSDLALWQSRFVKQQLESIGLEVDIHIVKTRGDKDLRPLKEIAGDGFFTKDLENMLLDKSIDLAIHSAKDLASLEHDELPWFAVGERESTRDVIVYNKHKLNIKDKNSVASIGTSSPRRRSQCQLEFPNFKIEELRGNVPTRLQKVTDGVLDAVILAEAGLKRLGLLESLPEHCAAYFPSWTTAPCQGILALQTTKENINILSQIENKDLTQIAKMEKSVLAFLGGGCHMAIGAQIENSQFRFFLERDQQSFQLEKSYQDKEDLNLHIYSDIASCLFSSATEKKQTILFTHSLNHHLKSYKQAHKHGINALSLACIDIVSCAKNDQSIEIIDKLKNFKNLVFTSQYAIRIFMMQVFHLSYDQEAFKHLNIFCVGNACLEKANEFGLNPVPVTWDANAKSLTKFLIENQFTEDLLFVGSSSSEFLKEFENADIFCTKLFVYKTISKKQTILPSLAPNIAISFASPSSVRFFIEKFGKESLQNRNIISIGPSTQRSLEKENINSLESKISGSWEQVFIDFKNTWSNK